MGFRSNILLLILISATSLAQRKAITLLDTNLASGNNYTTRQIYFNTHSQLLPESNTTLDSIVTFMNRNKAFMFEVGVHCDSRGATKNGGMMTMQRAESIVEYLRKHGIPKERLISKGYGSFKLLVSDKTIAMSQTKEEMEMLHAYNRRVVITVYKLGAFKQ